MSGKNSKLCGAQALESGYVEKYVDRKERKRREVPTKTPRTGRPRTFGEDVRAKVLALWKSGGNKTKIGTRCGVSRKTVLRILQDAGLPTDPPMKGRPINNDYIEVRVVVPPSLHGTIKSAARLRERSINKEILATLLKMYI